MNLQEVRRDLGEHVVVFTSRYFCLTRFQTAGTSSCALAIFRLSARRRSAFAFTVEAELDKAREALEAIGWRPPIGCN
jgi:hypothetical protein